MNTLIDTLDLSKKLNELPENIQKVYKTKNLRDTRKKLEKMKKELDIEFENGENALDLSTEFSKKESKFFKEREKHINELIDDLEDVIAKAEMDAADTSSSKDKYKPNYMAERRRSPYDTDVFERVDGVQKFKMSSEGASSREGLVKPNPDVFDKSEKRYAEKGMGYQLDSRSWTDKRKKLLLRQENKASSAVKQLTNLEAAELYSTTSVEIRRELYTNGNMMTYLKKDECIQDMIQKYGLVNQLSCAFVTPSSKAFSTSKEHNFKMVAATGESRTDMETLMTLRDVQSQNAEKIASSIDVQGYFSIGKWKPLNQQQIAYYKSEDVGGGKGRCKKIYEDDNFNEWEKMNCWLCGLPLSFNANSNEASYPQQPISCEHKNPVGVMFLQGAGVQTAIPTETMKRIPSNPPSATKPGIFVQRKTDEQIAPAWKEMVRAEGYGWSHHWCNMKKNQAPFFTVRDYISHEKGKKETHVTYQMEVNNIYHFVKDLFGLSENFLKGTDRREFVFTPGEKHYKFHKVDKEGSINQDPIRLWCAEMNLNKGECGEFKKKQAYNAFSNIIKMLIPTYYLLNSGSDVSDTTKLERDQLFGKRSMFKGIDKLTIQEKFMDNYGRILGYLSPNDRKHMLGKINATLGKQKSGTVPRLVSILFESVAAKDECYSDKDLAELAKDKEKLEDEFFLALQAVQRLKDTEYVPDEDAVFTRMNSLGPSIIPELGRATVEAQNKIRLDIIPETDEDDDGLERSLSDGSSVGDEEPPASLESTQLLESQSPNYEDFVDEVTVGGKRKKTRRKRRRKKKKTKKRIYFKDLLGDDVQSGGLIPRRIYFKDLL